MYFRGIDDDGNDIIIDTSDTLVRVPVQGDNGKWGYKRGKMYGDGWKVEPGQEWIIEPEYDKVWPFDPDLHIAQVKVNEEKFYIKYKPYHHYQRVSSEDLELDKYPADHDGVTYRGFNFIKTTSKAISYLQPRDSYFCPFDNAPERRFYQIFKDAWFDYNDVSEILAKAKSKFTPDHNPNWGKTRYKTMNEIIAETEVWLITDQDAKRGLSIYVRNRFTGKEEYLLIPADLGNSPVNEKDQDPRQWIERIKKLLYGEDVLKKEPMNEQNEADLQEIHRLTGEIKELLGPRGSLKKEPMNEQNEADLQKIAEDLRYKLIGRIKELIQTRDDVKKQPNEQRSKEIEEELRKLYKGLWGEDERTQTDWMGCYIPQTGTILIKIDSVDEVADLFGCPRDLLFQKVLLHEFIHAALDLCPRDADGNISSHKEEWKWEDADGEFFNEESIDNAIVLKLYKGTPDYRKVKGFIETQPYYYRRAVELDKSKLLFLLRDLIAYKISAPVSTTSTVSP